MGEPASLFVIGLPRSGTGETYVRAASMLDLRQPGWTSEGEILNFDRYAAYRARADSCAKFTSRERDPVLFGLLSEFLDTTVRPHGFAYKDVIQPLVVSEWGGLGRLRVLHVQRDVAEVACAMLKRGWVYPALVGGSNGHGSDDPLAPLESLVSGLLAAERSLQRVPAVRVEFEELIDSAEILPRALDQLYPDLGQHTARPLPPTTIAANAARRDALRREPEYPVLQELVERARAGECRPGVIRGRRRRSRPSADGGARVRGSGRRRELTIVLAFPGWMELPQGGCTGCKLSRDMRKLSSADAVVFHIPTTPIPIPVEKVSGQRWVAFSAESEINYPQLTDSAFMRQFDLTMSYRRDADIELADCLPEHWLPFRPAPLAVSREPVPAVYLASGTANGSRRTEYVRELMRHMQVDSFGRSLNNRTLANDRGRETKLETISRYRFTLSFENSIAPGYVTEKFYDPLVVGSVPVYLGAPDVADYAPAPDCYIEVRDFAGPAALAEFLLQLSVDEARYARYLAWRCAPLNPGFLALAEEQRLPAICRLCRLLREL